MVQKDLSNKQFVLLGGVGVVCLSVVFVVGAVVIELANLILRGRSVAEDI